MNARIFKTPESATKNMSIIFETAELKWALIKRRPYKIKLNSGSQLTLVERLKSISDRLVSSIVHATWSNRNNKSLFITD